MLLTPPVGRAGDCHAQGSCIHYDEQKFAIWNVTRKDPNVSLFAGTCVLACGHVFFGLETGWIAKEFLNMNALTICCKRSRCICFKQGLAEQHKFPHCNCVLQCPFSDFDVTFSKWQFYDDNMAKRYANLIFPSTFYRPRFYGVSMDSLKYLETAMPYLSTAFGWPLRRFQGWPSAGRVACGCLTTPL
jgi:hypothetical protein